MRWWTVGDCLVVKWRGDINKVVIVLFLQVIHFKRFRQHQLKGPQAAKLTTMVNFPMNGFDMSPHLAKSAGEDGGGGESAGGSSISAADSKYDLYAVCYHQGSTLETGHYTAACLNPYDQQWYRFDDQRVSQVPKERVEEEIINDEAYMLFYQRRKVDRDGSECSGSSSTTSSGEHWVSRIAPNVLPARGVEVKEKEKVLCPIAKIELEEVDEVKEEAVEEKVSENVDDNLVEVKENEDEKEEILDEDKIDGSLPVQIEKTEDAIEVAEESAVKESEIVVESNIEVKTIDKEQEDVKLEVVEVRKSSPIPIQRSSAPLDWSRAFDDRVGVNNNNRTEGRLSSQSYSNAVKARDLDTAVSLLRARSCSRDTFLFLDRRPPHYHRSSGRSLIDEDDVLGASNHSLWVS